MTTSIKIAGRCVGSDEPPYLIAELSANHNGQLSRALEIMEAAKEAGADAIKLQTYTADTITIDHNGQGFAITEGIWSGNSLYQLYQEASTPWEWHEALFAKGNELDIPVFSSPFDETAIKLLEDLDAPAYKIASFELIDLPLIRKVASTGKPVIMSTGMANLAEIAEAVIAAQSAGATEIALLHCTSGYPTPPSEADLKTIPHLAQAFQLNVGLSDHTPEIGAAVAAVAMGATIIEKHFTLDRRDGGPDASFSLEPDEFAALVRNSKLAWEAIGRVRYEKSEAELGNIQFRRSLYIVEDVRAGETLTEQNMRSIRPGYGLPPKFYDTLLGKRVNKDCPRGTPLNWDLMG